MHINTRCLASFLSLLVFYMIDLLVYAAWYGVADHFLYEKHSGHKPTTMPTISSSMRAGRHAQSLEAGACQRNNASS
jgi:hypothetical protein